MKRIAIFAGVLLLVLAALLLGWAGGSGTGETRIIRETVVVTQIVGGTPMVIMVTPTPSNTPTPDLPGTIAALEATLGAPTSTPIRVTGQPESTVTVGTVTPGATPTPTAATQAKKFACVNDGSGGFPTVCEDTARVLKENFSGAVVEFFTTCDERVVNELWSGIAIDNGLGGRSVGPGCIKRVLAEHPETVIIGQSLGFASKLQLTRAGARVTCNTGDMRCLIEAFKKYLP